MVLGLVVLPGCCCCCCGGGGGGGGRGWDGGSVGSARSGRSDARSGSSQGTIAEQFSAQQKCLPK